MAHVKQGFAIMMLVLAGCAASEVKLLEEQEVCLTFAQTDEAIEDCKTPLKEYKERMYKREDNAIRSREAFEIKKRACLRQGGFILIRHRGPTKIGRYDTHEMDLARCVKF